MPKNDFPMPTAKNRFQIFNLHPKKHLFKKNMVLNQKKYHLKLKTSEMKAISYSR